MSMESASVVYGGEYVLVGVPLLMNVPVATKGNRRPMQWIQRVTKKLHLPEGIVLEKDGGFRRPGETVPWAPGTFKPRWRIDAARDRIVIDWYNNGSYVPWRYDELRAVRPDATSADATGSIFEATYLACTGTSGRFHWNYELTVSDSKGASSRKSQSVLLATWSDNTEWEPPQGSSDSESSESHESSGDNATPGAGEHRRSPGLQPRTSPVDRRSANSSPRESGDEPLRVLGERLTSPQSRRAPQSAPQPAPQPADGFAFRCWAAVKRCCGRRRRTGRIIRRPEAPAPPAAEDTGMRAALRRWRSGAGGGARDSPLLRAAGANRNQESPGKVKLLNEELPMGQKENP